MSRRLLLFSGFKNRSLGWSERIHPRDLEMVTPMMSALAWLLRNERSDVDASAAIGRVVGGRLALMGLKVERSVLMPTTKINRPIESES